jgi:hypothetical protein
MGYSFDKVMLGLSEYISNEVYSGMNDLQEFMARVVVGRMLDNKDSIRETLINNGFVRTFGFIDSDGLIDLEGIASSLKKEISRKGRLSISIPMFGKLTFVPEDIDTLCNYIKGA